MPQIFYIYIYQKFINLVLFLLILLFFLLLLFIIAITGYYKVLLTRQIIQMMEGLNLQKYLLLCGLDLWLLH